MIAKNSKIISVIFTIVYCFDCSKLAHVKNRTAINLEPKVVGGTEAYLDSYPFAVQFFNKGAMCGGVIFNSWTIITAAHCFAINTDTDKMVVQAGSRYLYDFKSDKYNVKSFAVHEKYGKEKTFACDIALLFLEQPIKFGKLVKKVILVDHNKWSHERETDFIVTGWGWTKYGGKVSNSLMVARLRYVPSKECTRLHNNYVLTSDMFCLYGDGKRDTCRGDSGGGVLWNGMLVGLTSHGDGCAKRDSPSVYTNVWLFRSWIKERVEDFIKQFCSKQYKTEQR